MKKSILIILIAFTVVLLQRAYYENKLAGAKERYNDLITCEQLLDQTQDICNDLIIEAQEQAREEILSMF